jgi:hypothetical protein
MSFSFNDSILAARDRDEPARSLAEVLGLDERNQVGGHRRRQVTPKFSGTAAGGRARRAPWIRQSEREAGSRELS